MSDKVFQDYELDTLIEENPDHVITELADAGYYKSNDLLALNSLKITFLLFLKKMFIFVLLVMNFLSLENLLNLEMAFLINTKFILPLAVLLALSFINAPNLLTVVLLSETLKKTNFYNLIMNINLILLCTNLERLWLNIPLVLSSVP